ncbi:MAG: histone deacetylase family protein [Parvularculaceae bacterium]
MKVVFAEAQRRHFPEHFLVNGVFQPNTESPARIDRLLEGAREAGFLLERPADCGIEPIQAVHDARYLAFLEKAYARWRRIDGGSAAVTPNIHPVARDCSYPDSVVAQAGWHMLDAGAPIDAHTYESALASAASAVHAADLVLSGDAFVYALSRPPGHHARQDAAAGFCYINNGAVAAVRLQKKFGKIAILDVDLHHGNGTQDIFYERNDVLTISIHADPARFYPFFWGAAAEKGRGPGDGFNLNLPLPRGSGDAVFLAALDTALARIDAFGADALVIALGLDAFEGDPFGGLGVTTQGFSRIGGAIGGAIARPTVIVQEGGYLCDALGGNLTAFLASYASARRK